jgi:hypothetical protein
MRNWLNVQQLVPLTILILGAVLAVMTSQMEEPAAFQQVSSTIWPTTLTIVLMLCGAIILIENVKRPELLTPSEEEEDRLPPGPQGWLFILVIALFGPAIFYLGFIIAGVALTFTTMVLFGAWEKHRLQTILTSIILPGVLYWLITHVIGQILPEGILF